MISIFNVIILVVVCIWRWAIHTWLSYIHVAQDRDFYPRNRRLLLRLHLSGKKNNEENSIRFDRRTEARCAMQNSWPFDEPINHSPSRVTEGLPIKGMLSPGKSVDKLTRPTCVTGKPCHSSFMIIYSVCHALINDADTEKSFSSRISAASTELLLSAALPRANPRR